MMLLQKVVSYFI